MITVGTAATKAREEAEERLFPRKRRPSGRRARALVRAASAVVAEIRRCKPGRPE